MAKVDLARRAQIGQQKRARTHAALVAAAKSLFALRSIESVTIDEIVAEAGLAKGTFYTHFDDLDALTAAVADELVAAFDDLMQPSGWPSPTLSIASLSAASFHRKSARGSWLGAGGDADGALLPSSGRGDAQPPPRGSAPGAEECRGACAVPDLALKIVVGLMLPALSAFAERRVSRDDREPMLAALLRALGADAPPTSPRTSWCAD